MKLSTFACSPVAMRTKSASIRCGPSGVATSTASTRSCPVMRLTLLCSSYSCRAPRTPDNEMAQSSSILPDRRWKAGLRG